MDRLEAKLLKIGRDPKITARSVGLRYAAFSGKGFFRKRKRNGFTYVDENGLTIEDRDILDRIQKLVIPPAWEHVWISPFENGHLQVTGIDKLGRKQYRYHPDWNKIRNQSKFYRLRNFAKALPAIRRQVEKDLNRKGLPYEKVLALVVRLIEDTNIRIGNDAYKKLYGSFGLTTLRDKHVKTEKSGIRFEFTGKKGVKHSISLRSRKLANLVKKCKDIPGQELFQYYEEDGTRCTIGSADVNAYLKQITGDDFTAKDFRAWSGSVTALQCFRDVGPARNKTEEKKKVVEVIDCVAKKLGNTRSVCKKYYVHPTVIAAYEHGNIDKYKVRGNIKGNHLSAEEEALKRLLKTERIAQVLG